MKFLKIYPDGKSKIINLPDTNNYDDLTWMISVELSKEISDFYTPSDILVDTGVVAWGPNKKYYPDEPINKWVSNITGENVYGPCICFSVRKRNGVYQALGFTQGETKYLKADLKIS